MIKKRKAIIDIMLQLFIVLKRKYERIPLMCQYTFTETYITNQIMYELKDK